MAKYRVSPIGELKHPWINKADIKFNANGLFHSGLIVGGKEAQDLKEAIDASVEEAFAELTDKMQPKDVKKYSKFYPYEVDEDDDGNPTGYIVFDFKQNATIGEKKISIEIRDSEDKVVNVPIYGGTEARIMFSPRAIKMDGTKQIGVRLDFAKVQVVKLASGSGGTGFGAVEGGYKAPEGGATAAPSGEEEQGDY